MAAEECAEALFHLLSHIPSVNGLPRVAGPWRDTDGPCHCDIYLAERQWRREPFQFEDLRWRCVLTNFATADLDTFDARLALAYVAGEVDARGRPV